MWDRATNDAKLLRVFASFFFCDDQRGACVSFCHPSKFLAAFVNEGSNRVSAEVLGNATAMLDQLSTIAFASALP